jgi:hypothetical protein
MELEEPPLIPQEVIMELDPQAMLGVCTMDNIVVWKRTPGNMFIPWERVVAFGPADPLQPLGW